MKTSFKSHHFFPYTFHYSSLFKWIIILRTKGIYSTKHQKQKKRRSFEGSDQTPCQPSEEKHQENIPQGAEKSHPQEKPPNLPPVLCAFTAVWHGRERLGFQIRGNFHWAWCEVILFHFFFGCKSCQVGKHIFFFSRWKWERRKRDLLELRCTTRSRTDLVKWEFIGEKKISAQDFAFILKWNCGISSWKFWINLSAGSSDAAAAPETQLTGWVIFSETCTFLEWEQSCFWRSCLFLKHHCHRGSASKLKVNSSFN